jgi:hypothetical protein
MSSKETCNSPGLHPIEGQKSSLGAQTGSEINSRACRDGCIYLYL